MSYVTLHHFASGKAPTTCSGWNSFLDTLGDSSEIDYSIQLFLFTDAGYELSPGTYNLGGSDAGSAWGGQVTLTVYSTVDYQPDTGSESTQGTVTLTSVGSSVVGTFDAWMIGGITASGFPDAGEISGSFDVPVCPGLL